MPLLPRIIPRNSEQRQAQAYRQLMRDVAQMGGRLFGPIPDGHRREFFCLDEHTWVWHEEWVDARGVTQAVTTRYDIQPQAILKSQGANSYQQVRGSELRNLYQAARLYYRNVQVMNQKLQA